jgi:hypothetical protein
VVRIVVNSTKAAHDVKILTGSLKRKECKSKGQCRFITDLSVRKQREKRVQVDSPTENFIAFCRAAIGNTLKGVDHFQKGNLAEIPKIMLDFSGLFSYIKTTNKPAII